jgi:hypothetical protein
MAKGLFLTALLTHIFLFAFDPKYTRTNSENIITVNQHVLRELENNVFILGDLDISIEEIPLIIRFMASKEVRDGAMD